VHILDFEEMQPEAWMVDLGRMAIGWWRDEPHLMDAVLAGYGRTMSADEVAVMRCCYTVTAVRHIVLGVQFGKTDFVAATRDVLRHLMGVLR